MKEWLIIGLVVLMSGVFLGNFTSLDVSAAVGWVMLAGGFVFLLTYVLVSGIRTRQYKYLPKEKAEEHLDFHRRCVTFLIGMIAVGATGIEIAVQRDGGEWFGHALYLTHLFFVISTLVSIVVVGKFVTGVKDASEHKVVAYYFMFFYGMMLVSGTVLLRDRFDIAALARLTGLAPSVSVSVQFK
jgi:hypothetical protein